MALAISPDDKKKTIFRLGKNNTYFKKKKSYLIKVNKNTDYNFRILNKKEMCVTLSDVNVFWI